jgi:hypothetical protein
MNFHDVWISVADWQTQVLIEFGYSPSEYLSYKVWSGLSEEDCDHHQAMRRIFFCEGCNEWSISEEARQQFIEWGKTLQYGGPPRVATAKAPRHPGTGSSSSGETSPQRDP